MVLQTPGSHQIDPEEGVDGGVRWRGEGDEGRVGKRRGGVRG